MLQTKIDTTDPTTGTELPVPSDLLAKVERADGALRGLLRKVSKGF